MLAIPIVRHHYTGASCVGELLKVNNSLQELDMRHNHIGDDGMSSVADGLQCNNTITKLNVLFCGFSVKGSYSHLKCSYDLCLQSCVTRFTKRGLICTIINIQKYQFEICISRMYACMVPLLHNYPHICSYAR